MIKILKKHFRSIWEFIPLITLKCFFFTLLFAHSTFVYSSSHCLTAQQQLSQVKDWTRVYRIVDGDTIHLVNGQKIRFTGINTPEIGYKGKASQAYARQAKKALQDILKQNKKVGLYYDQERQDRYKRILAYLILDDGQNIAEILLKKGLAYSIVVPPNDLHINCFRQLESQARQSSLGIWQLPYNQLISAPALAKNSNGYRFISGTVQAYSESRK